MLIGHFRESNTLRRQVEQMLQKLSPLEKCQEELDSVKAELEEKKVTSSEGACIIICDIWLFSALS